MCNVIFRFGILSSGGRADDLYRSLAERIVQERASDGISPGLCSMRNRDSYQAKIAVFHQFYAVRQSREPRQHFLKAKTPEDRRIGVAHPRHRKIPVHVAVDHRLAPQMRSRRDIRFDT